MHRTATLQTAVILVFAEFISVAAQQRAADLGSHLLQTPAVRAAVESARTDEAQTLDDQIRLCEVEAPPFQEAKRAQLFADDVARARPQERADRRRGNVLGERPGASATPERRDQRASRHGLSSGHQCHGAPEGLAAAGPGIGDDCRGLATVLAVARALNKAGVATPGTITFVATVGEEGLGDLRGVKRLFNETLKGRIDRFVVDRRRRTGRHPRRDWQRTFSRHVQGAGRTQFRLLRHRESGARAGRAVARIADFQVPSSPRTTFNVGRIGGGTSINAIASEAWMEVDSAPATRPLCAPRKAVEAGRPGCGRRRERAMAQPGAHVVIETVGMRPAARMPASAPIVQAAISVSKALNLPVSFSEGSTDANFPMSLGIPALTIDSGGRGSGCIRPTRVSTRPTPGRSAARTFCSAWPSRSPDSWITLGTSLHAADQTNQIQAQHATSCWRCSTGSS